MMFEDGNFSQSSVHHCSQRVASPSTAELSVLTSPSSSSSSLSVEPHPRPKIDPSFDAKSPSAILLYQAFFAARGDPLPPVRPSNLADHEASDDEDDCERSDDGQEQITEKLNDCHEAISRRSGDDDESDAEPSRTWLSLATNFHHYPSGHRKKLAMVLISVASWWLYSSCRKDGRKDRRHGIARNYSSVHVKILGVYRLILKLLSSMRISNTHRGVSKKNRISGAVELSSFSQNPAVTSWEQATPTPLSHLLALAKTGDISKVMLRGSILSYLHSIQSNNGSNPQNRKEQQRWSKTTLPSQNPNFVQEILSKLLKHGCDDITSVPDSLLQRFLNGPALILLPMAYLGAMYRIMRRLQTPPHEESSHPEIFQTTSNPLATFRDVAGMDKTILELSDVVSYLRDPTPYSSLGASPPRGILLHGPPGTGKTLLARAIAGEARTIDCFAVRSGSEFVEVYSGMGAARVRALFRGVRAEAWKNHQKRKRRRAGWGSGGDSSDEATDRRPMAIIFIDEFDALAKRRDSGTVLSTSGGCDEREQTLNQLLTEMDGFSSTQSPVEGPMGVIVTVIAATNRPSILDPAVLRAGRFDRHVSVPLPDSMGREAILRVHARRIRYDSTVNFRELALGTVDFSGADLKNVVNEGALLAVRMGSERVGQEHLREAVGRVNGRIGGSGRQSGHRWFVG